MRGNQFGKVFCLSTFGESHGPALGALIEGCPAGVTWQGEMLTRFMNRRRPGQSAVTSARGEPDAVEVLSGVFEDRTLGTPIAAIVRNQDARSGDYAADRMNTRRGHATDLWQNKFGHSDPRGSGRASGRETLSRVIGGAVARMLVTQLHPGVRVIAFTSRVGSIHLKPSDCIDAAGALEDDPWHVDQFTTRCPSIEKNELIEVMLREAKQNGESYGGEVFVAVHGAPAGLGQPVFDKIKAEFAHGYLSVGATGGVTLSDGFEAAQMNGQQFHHSGQDYGGVRGGLTTGDPVTMRVAFKPTSSRGEVATLGRHDPCIVPRAVPVIEAMTWLTLADQILRSRLDRV